jgi:hypothetical protein
MRQLSSLDCVYRGCEFIEGGGCVEAMLMFYRRKRCLGRVRMRGGSVYLYIDLYASAMDLDVEAMLVLNRRQLWTDTRKLCLCSTGGGYARARRLGLESKLCLGLVRVCESHALYRGRMPFTRELCPGRVRMCYGLYAEAMI